jgi:formylglycine-generating enzyme required for sulfatase activity
MAGKRLALLIANAEYRHPELQKLNAPQDDVRALETLLERPDIGRYQTQVLIDATKWGMEMAIAQLLADSERDDTALVFFAGHGLKHQNGKLYFAAIDTNPEYLGPTAVSAGWLTEQMQNSQVGRQIVLLDCCFGGAFARGNVWGRGGQVESGKALEVPDLELEGRGQVVITSADAMQFALEDGALNDKPPASHFVRALREGLETGEADCNPQDGRITIDELMSYLVRKLKILGSPQRPSKWTFGAIGGDLLFAYYPWTKEKGMEFALIPTGEFQMRLDDDGPERPARKVHISQPFYLGKYPVTQAQWAAVMGNNPSEFKGDPNRPVEKVSWEEVQQFIRDLNAREGNERYRLPTEAEWEYACRAGSTTAYCFGDDEGRLGEYAWYIKNAGGQTHPVGKLEPNAWGLYDMHGNVWEWVQDWRDAREVERVNRGGSWVFDANYCRSTTRGHVTPGHRAYDLGFRLLKTVP